MLDMPNGAHTFKSLIFLLSIRMVIECNKVADTLSRRTLMLTIMSTQIVGSEELKNQYVTNSYLSSISY